MKDKNGKISAEEIANFLPKLESTLNTIGSYQLPENKDEIINAIVNGNIAQCNYGNAAELLANTYEGDILIKDYNEKTKTSVLLNEGIVCMLRKITDEEWLKNYKRSLLYQTDGHFGTVYLVSLMLGIGDAKQLAYYAEYPDNIVNFETNKAELRTTWGNAENQTKLHALTNGFHGEEEFTTALALLNMDTYPEEALKKYGYMLHRYCDTYAHTRIEDRKLTDVDLQQMYGKHAEFSSGGLETVMWFLGATAQHQEVDGKTIGSAPDMIKNDPERYLKYVKNLSEILSLRYFGFVKNIDTRIFEKMANYAKINDVSLMGIIHYEIAKYQNLHEFILPYPVLASTTNEDMVGHYLVGSLLAIPAERTAYEKWILDTEKYIKLYENKVEMARHSEYIQCGNDAQRHVDYETKFKW